MRAYIRMGIRLILAVLYVIIGLLISGLLFLCLPKKYASKIVQRWCSGALKVFCGVKVIVHGQPVTEGPMLWVANHVSWLDPLVISSFRGSDFIAKEELNKWPVIRYIIRSAGTIFIKRGAREQVPAMNEAIMQRFSEGRCVGLFPEGRISDGKDVQHMHAGLLESVVKTSTALQAITLVYTRNGQFDPDIPWEGDQPFFENFCGIIKHKVVEAHVYFSPLLTESGLPLLENRIELVERAKVLIKENLDPYVVQEV